MKAAMARKKHLQRKQSAASAMFHEVDRTRSSTGHSTLMTSMSESEGRELEEDVRRSSIAVLRADARFEYNNPNDPEGLLESGEKPSWWEQPDMTEKSCGQRVRLAFDSLVLVGIGVSAFLAAHFTENQALPFVFAVLAALATFESSWLSYRLRLRLFLPFKLHQKQTDRDIYTQIMNYSVDLQTCAITPFAERVFRGRKLVAAGVTAIVSGGIAFPIAWAAIDDSLLVAYITVTVFLAVWCASLSPNVRDAAVLVVRYSYYALSTASILILSPPSASLSLPSVSLEPFHLLLLSASLILIIRALTSKEPMETIVMTLLDISGLIYLSCIANVINYLAAFTSTPGVSAEDEEDATSRHTIVFGVFFVVWCGELGSFLMEKLLREAQFPWTHPLSSRLSSRQNVEKLTGALLFGVGASFIVTDVLIPTDVLPVTNVVFVVTSIAAIVASHVCKLWLISLKKVAKVSATGRYLQIGDGVIDRIDSILVGTIVFAVVLRRAL